METNSFPGPIITSVIEVPQRMAVAVYNIEVEGAHTYFAEGVLVHNRGAENYLKRRNMLARQEAARERESFYGGPRLKEADAYKESGFFGTIGQGLGNIFNTDCWLCSHNQEIAEAGRMHGKAGELAKISELGYYHNKDQINDAAIVARRDQLLEGHGSEYGNMSHADGEEYIALEKHLQLHSDNSNNTPTFLQSVGNGLKAVGNAIADYTYRPVVDWATDAEDLRFARSRQALG